MIFILTTLFAMTILYSSKDLVTFAAENEEPDIIYYPNYSDVSAAKFIEHGAEAISEGVTGNYSYVGETFTVKIEVSNFGSQDIYGVNVTSVESNVTELGYNKHWFDFPGNDPSGQIGYLPPGTDDLSYTITPLSAGTFTFPGSNITYSNGTRNFYVLSNPITFIVYEEPPSVVVEKTILFEGDEYSTNARVKKEREFFIKINITNYEYENVNVTAIDNPPGLPTEFLYNETLLSRNFSVINTLSSGIYQYSVYANLTGDFVIPNFNITYFIEGIPTPEISENSNQIELEVYEPIYEGNDWSQKVPMLSVSKYFQWFDPTIGEDGLLVNETKIEFTNETENTITIMLNITLHNNVSAFDVSIQEPVYNNWVFETEGVPIAWGPFNLTENDNNIILNYTITTKILGIFKIEPTIVTYSYINQETLLEETDNILYSNVIEVKIKAFIPERDLTSEWWATIGISLGIVALVAIPLVVTFVMYGKRRRIQRGT
jgi:hypothetical protein